MSWKLSFTPKAWEHYLYWQQTDKAVLKRINGLLKEITRHPFEGKGDPEMLKADLQGYWSRRIDKEHRIVYQVTDEMIEIIACRFHYQDK